MIGSRLAGSGEAVPRLAGSGETLDDRWVGAAQDEPLSRDALSEFVRSGFLVIDAPQIPAGELAWCRDILMRLIDKGVGRSEGRNLDLAARDDGNDGVSPELCRPSLYANELNKFSYRIAGLAIARQILGPSATFAGDNAILKPPRVGGPTPWHQDEAYNDPRFYQEQVAIWIALYPATLENGAMAYVPGSHRLGILPHRLNGGAADANHIECVEGFDRSSAVVCPLAAGAMVLHHGRTVHGAAGNTSDTPRLGYILIYKTPPKARPELGEFPWNARVGAQSRQHRRKWLARGGIFIELLRFIRADRDAQRHLINQVRHYFGR